MEEVNYPPDVSEILWRLVKLFPLDDALAAEWQPGSYDNRFSNHIGHLDITYDQEELVEHVKIVRITVWNGCDALLGVDVFPRLSVRKVHAWQDEKVREQLIPLLDQALVLEDLSDV
jgi:hypothetical protein